MKLMSLSLFIISITLIAMHLSVIEAVSFSRHKKFKTRGIDNKSTTENDWGDNDIRFLDRHQVNCDGQSAINAFKLTRPKPNSIKYEYKCISNQSIEPAEEQLNTGWNDTSNNVKSSLNFLDRHNLKCNGNSVLKKFSLRSNGKKIRFEYSCSKALLGDCRGGQTNWSDTGGWQLVYLDRHQVQLADNEALTQFKAEAANNKFRYTFTACVVIDPPTPALATEAAASIPAAQEITLVPTTAPVKTQEAAPPATTQAATPTQSPTQSSTQTPSQSPTPKPEIKTAKKDKSSKQEKPDDGKSWISKKINIPSLNAEIKVHRAPKISFANLDKTIDSINKSMGKDGLLGKKDLIVVTEKLLLWFATSKSGEGKIIDSSGGLLAGIWNVQIDEKTKEVKLTNDKNLLFPGSETDNKSAGNEVSGKYANVANIKWGIQYSTSFKKSKRSGKTILSIEKGAYSADDGIFVEFVGTLANSGTGPGIETLSDTDPTVGISGETQYTLTYRIPASRPELIQEVEFLTKKGQFGPVNSAKIKLQLPNYLNKPLSFATAPEPQVPNKTLDLGKVFVNKYFKNSCVNEVYFYDIAYKQHKEKLIARLPAGKGQIACLGAPSTGKDSVPFICAYPNNDYIPKETYGEYTLDVVEDRADQNMHALDYNLISTPTLNLTFKEKEKLVLIMRYKILDAKIELDQKGDNLKTIKIR